MPDVKQALQWVAAVWKAIKPQSVQNCWVKAGIVPPSWDIAADHDQHEPLIEDESAGLQQLIDEFHMGSDALSATEFVDYPGEDQVLARLDATHGACSFITTISCSFINQS